MLTFTYSVYTALAGGETHLLGRSTVHYNVREWETQSQLGKYLTEYQIFLRFAYGKINSRRKLRADKYTSMKIFARNNESESGLCRGLGDRLVGVSVLHGESLKQDTNIIVHVSAFDA